MPRTQKEKKDPNRNLLHGQNDRVSSPKFLTRDVSSATSSKNNDHTRDWCNNVKLPMTRQEKRKHDVINKQMKHHDFKQHKTEF